jgi:hypothetical protein
MLRTASGNVERCTGLLHVITHPSIALINLKHSQVLMFSDFMYVLFYKAVSCLCMLTIPQALFVQAWPPLRASVPKWPPSRGHTYKIKTAQKFLRFCSPPDAHLETKYTVVTISIEMEVCAAVYSGSSCASLLNGDLSSSAYAVPNARMSSE